MAERIGKGINAEIKVDYAAGILGLSLVPQTDQGDALMPAVLERLMHAIMEVANAEFGVSGSFTEVNKPKKIRSR